MFDDPRSDDTRDRDDWRERELDARDRKCIDPRDVFTEGLNLPRGREREIVFDRGHHYEIRGLEARTLADVGVFRVVLSRDLQDHNGQPCDPRKGFCNRATHNLFVLLNEAVWADRQLMAGTHERPYQRRVNNSIYRPIIQRLVERRILRVRVA